MEAPFQAADHRIRIAALHGERADHRRVGAHQGLGGIGRDALAARRLDIGRDIVAIARIVLRIDELEMRGRLHRQAEALDARLDDVRAADQDRLRDAFLDDRPGGAQHALVLALGVDDALRVGLRLR